MHSKKLLEYPTPLFCVWWITNLMWIRHH